MATTLKTMMDRLPAERQARVKARAEELIAEELTQTMTSSALSLGKKSKT